MFLRFASFPFWDLVWLRRTNNWKMSFGKKESDKRRAGKGGSPTVCQSTRSFFFEVRSIVELLSILSTFLRTNFLYERRFSSFYYIHATRNSCQNDVRTKNLYVTCWWNWHLLSILSTFYANICLYGSALSIFSLVMFCNFSAQKYWRKSFM